MTKLGAVLAGAGLALAASFGALTSAAGAQSPPAASSRFDVRVALRS